MSNWDDVELKKSELNDIKKTGKKIGNIKPFAELLKEFLLFGSVFVNRGELGIAIENFSQAGYIVFVPAFQRKYAEEGILLMSFEKYRAQWEGKNSGTYDHQ